MYFLKNNIEPILVSRKIFKKRTFGFGKAQFISKILYTPKEFFSCRDYLSFHSNQRVVCLILISLNVSLQRRVEFLSLSLGNAKSATELYNPQFIRELEDSLDVAQIQMKIVDLLKNTIAIPPELSHLLDLSTVILS
jgi:hypothetical protein